MRALPRHALGLVVLVGLGAAPTPGSAGPGLRELVFYATNPMDVRGMQRCPASSPFKPKPLCSLREAIEAANAVVGLVAVPVYVRLGAGQTYTLTMPVPLEISSGMTVERDPNDLPGPADPVIDGNATVDPLKVRAGVSASIKHVVIEHGAGVGLRNAGRTTLRSVEVRDNCKAGEGAGVVNDGDLTIEASSIHDNACNNRTTGAGIVQWSGTTVMRDSDLRKNSLINGDGAAIDVEAGSFTFEGGAIDGNTSAKTTILSKGTLTIGPNAVFVNNTGPIWAMGPLRIIESTITDNHFGAGVGFYECVVFNTAREAALLDGVLFARNDGPYCKQAGGNATTILNSHFLFNISNNFAGAFDEEQSADLDIQGSTFAYNKGRRAGAIFLSGFGVHGPNATLSDTHIHENESTGDGGGMTLHGYRVSLRDSDLDSNLAAGRGGAIFTESFFDPKGNDPPARELVDHREDLDRAQFGGPRRWRHLQQRPAQDDRREHRRQPGAHWGRRVQRHRHLDTPRGIVAHSRDRLEQSRPLGRWNHQCPRDDEPRQRHGERQHHRLGHERSPYGRRAAQPESSPRSPIQG